MVAIVLHLLYKTTLYLLVWTLWLPRGKDILFVYSDSPIWRDYMTSEVLPLVHERAVVLNWSERKKWERWSLGLLCSAILEVVSLTPSLCCFGRFVLQGCSASGRHSKIGNMVTENP